MPKLIDRDERRRQVARAAWRVIRRDGVAGASIRTVAAEAGVSTGSLQHVFATRSELLRFTFRLVVDQVGARVSALPPQPSGELTAEAISAELLPLDEERRAEMEVYLALVTAATSDADLRATRDDALGQMRSACAWILTHLSGSPLLATPTDRQLEATRLHALIDGLAAHLIWDAAPDPQHARRVLRRHLNSLAPDTH